MSTPHATRIMIAIGFVVAMLALGSVNPNGALGEASCGLVCDAKASTTLR